MKKVNLYILAFGISMACILGSCERHVVKTDKRFQVPGSPVTRVVVTSPYGNELVEGNLEQVEGCIRYETVIKGKTVRRVVCGSYMLSGIPDGKLLNKQLKNY